MRKQKHKFEDGETVIITETGETAVIDRWWFPIGQWIAQYDIKGHEGTWYAEHELESPPVVEKTDDAVIRGVGTPIFLVEKNVLTAKELHAIQRIYDTQVEHGYHTIQLSRLLFEQLLETAREGVNYLEQED